jgi:hypothetical protein
MQLELSMIPIKTGAPVINEYDDSCQPADQIQLSRGNSPSKWSWVAIEWKLGAEFAVSITQRSLLNSNE